MQKSLWVFAFLFVIVGAPNAHAQDYDVTFTCIGTCLSMPTASEVSFPSPTSISIIDDDSLVIFPLAAGDLPTDSYTWDAFPGIQGVAPSTFNLTDVTTGDTPTFRDGVLAGEGTVEFTEVLTPEPGTAVLWLTGIVLIILMRKRLAQLLRVDTGRTAA